MMEQKFLKKTFSNYDHLKNKYRGFFCKDEMDKLIKAIKSERSLHERIFALINTGTKQSSGEHWMGLIINHRINSWLLQFFQQSLLVVNKCNEKTF